MAKVFVVLAFIAVNILGTSHAFWSLDTDLQLGYEIYDRSYEINAVIQAIATAASRSNVIQRDDSTRNAVNSLNSLANQLKSSPVSFFNEISNAAASRTNNEAWLISRIRSSHTNYDATLKVLLNVTGPLMGLSDVSNPYVIAIVRSTLARLQVEGNKILAQSEDISQDISKIRANSSLLLTPDLLSDFIDPSTTEEIISSLVATRNTFAILLSAVRDVGRLTVAHGSVHELLSRSFTKDETTRSSALNNFVNNYNRVRNNLVSSVATYRQAAETGIYNFITRVQSTYDDTIIRPKFDQLQLPLIKSFANVISSKVYNQTFFQSSFDEMRDAIVNLFDNATASSLSHGSEHREVILDLQRTSFVRRYSHCIDELIAEAQGNSNSLTSKYAFCLNERTSGIVVVIPSTSTWLSVIRDNINFILQQLNACLNGQTSVAGRTGISDCIQFNTNNLPFYSAYLPVTVESNLRPITQNTPLIFQNCVNLISMSEVSRFDEIHSKCQAEAESSTTTVPTTTQESTTEEVEYGSGESEFTDSYILV